MSSAILDGVIGLVPAKEQILKAAARLPPGLRSPQSSRIFAALARRATMKASTLRCNMGIDRNLDCEMPIDQVFALYGKPELYRGERASLELAARLSRSCDAFVDVGAHLGYFTFFVSTRSGNELPIYFFEPDPVLFARLDRNVHANRLDRVRGSNTAIGATDGSATFYVNRSDSLSGSLTNHFATAHDVVATEIGVERFATVAARLDFRRACVKVDVEGAEAAFLDGAADALSRVACLIIEVLGPAHEQRFVQSVIARSGLSAYYINDYRLEHSADGSFEYRAPEYNWLFCGESPEELATRLGGAPFHVVSKR